ncbi:hypothetical protein [Acinetobacter guillouiae]|uniref:hypothetical protein n=1 Tax=Acinetobacter guillouiae TaxID=106649 RepID=UPI002E1C7E1F
MKKIRLTIEDDIFFQNASQENYILNLTNDIINSSPEYSIKEKNNIYNKVKYGVSRCEYYGILRDDLVYKYIGIMFSSAGTFFDENPIYLHKTKVLTDNKINKEEEIEKIYEYFSELSKKITNNESKYIYFSLNYLISEIFIDNNIDVDKYIKLNLIDKYLLVDYSKLNELKEKTKKDIKKYGISEKYIYDQFYLISFILGYRWYLDPRYPNIEEYLTSKNLLNEKINLIEKFINNKAIEKKKFIENVHPKYLYRGDNV